MFTVKFKPLCDFVPKTDRTVEVFIFERFYSSFGTKRLTCEIHYQLRDLTTGAYYPSSCGTGFEVEHDGIPFGKPVKFVDGKAILLTKDELEIVKTQEKPYVWVKDWYLHDDKTYQINSNDDSNEVIGWVDVDEYEDAIVKRCKELSKAQEDSYAERDVGYCKAAGCSGAFIIKKDGDLKGACSNPFCSEYNVLKPLSQSRLKFGIKDEKFYYEKIRSLFSEGKLTLKNCIDLYEACYNITVCREDLDKYLKEEK